MVRLYASIERDGAWDDQCTILIACDDIQPATDFVTSSVKEISREASGLLELEDVARH
jgi:hypothetical protein